MSCEFASLVLVLGLAYFIFKYNKKTSKSSLMQIPPAPEYKEDENEDENTSILEKHEVIIVGAGVAGSALAYVLGKDGRQVRVIERDMTQPNRIVGEVLQLGGYLKLVEMGLQDCVEEIDGKPMVGYALYKKGKSTTLPYPQPQQAGRTFHNGRFIQKMRQKAASLPNVTFEQGKVTSVIVKEKGIVKGVKYKRTNDDEERTAYASLTIVSDGSFSNLRRFLCKPKVNAMSFNFLGFVLENCRLPYENHAIIVLAEPSPVWLYSISSTEIRCLIDIPGRQTPSIFYGQMAQYLKSKIVPQMPPELHVAFRTAIEKGIRLRKIQNGSMRAAPYASPGALLVGDALNMRHPFAGGGMTVALSDVCLIRDLMRPLVNLKNASATWESLQLFYTLRQPLSNTIDIMARALCGVFCCPNDEAMKEMQQVCFDYLRLGGVFKHGLIQLVSGTNSQPLWLIPHFFAMTLYCFASLLLPFPSPRRLLIAATLISGVSKFIWRRFTR